MVGFDGKTCEIDIDECSSNPCQHEGTCQQWENSYKCFCRDGFEGKNCERNINDCAQDPCLEDGQCVDLVNDFKCLCKPGIRMKTIISRIVWKNTYVHIGFTGIRCEEEINECEPNPCVNDGDCRDLINGYLCNCKDGFTGTNCEININECDPDPCLNGATCLDLDSRYECQCPVGFKGNLVSNCLSLKILFL